MGVITGGILDQLRVPWAYFPEESSAIAPALERAMAHLRREERPYAFIMRKGTVASHRLSAQADASQVSRSYATPNAGRPGNTATRPTRSDALRRIVDLTPADNTVVIATTGYTGRELFALADRPNHLYVVGSMHSASKFVAFIPVVLICAALSGCGTLSASGEDEFNDPYEPFNRKVFAFNQTLDRNVVKPVATAYRDALPQFVRDRIHFVLSNLGEPLILVNNVLQLRLEAASATFGRFVINSIAGFGGMAAVLGGGCWLYTSLGGEGASLTAALAYSNVVFGGAVLVWLFNSLANVIRGTGIMSSACSRTLSSPSGRLSHTGCRCTNPRTS